MLVTNYKPPRLTGKQSDTQVNLTLVALEHASGRLGVGQMASITSEHTDLSVHWNSTVLRSQLTSTPAIGTILQFFGDSQDPPGTILGTGGFDRISPAKNPGTILLCSFPSVLRPEPFHPMAF